MSSTQKLLLPAPPPPLSVMAANHKVVLNLMIQLGTIVTCYRTSISSSPCLFLTFVLGKRMVPNIAKDCLLICSLKTLFPSPISLLFLPSTSPQINERWRASSPASQFYSLGRTLTHLRSLNKCGGGKTKWYAAIWADHMVILL